MGEMTEITYKFEVDPGKRLLVVILSGLACFFLMALAKTTDTGMIIKGIRLDVNQARIFKWILAGLCGGLACYGLHGLMFAPKGPRFISLDDFAITVPKSMSHNIVKVSYDQITDLELQEVHNHRFLVIHHPGGKLNIAQAVMNSRDQFDDLHDQLNAKIRAAQVK